MFAMIAQVNYSKKQTCSVGLAKTNVNLSLPKITKHSTFLGKAGVAKGFRKHFPNSEGREMGVSE